jgi:hypothetical protein
MLGKLLGRGVILGGRFGRRRAFFDLGLELQREIDRRVDEGGHRRERNHQPRRHLIERQADLEAVVQHAQIPEPVLDDDRHLVGKALRQVARNLDPRSRGLEGDVEVMTARQPAALLDDRQHAADHRAQRFLDDFVVGNQAV